MKPGGKRVYDQPIRRAARNSNTPGGGIGNADCSSSRKGDCKQKYIAGFWRAREVSLVSPVKTIPGNLQVSDEVFRAPVLDNNRKGCQNWYREQIVVKHGIPIRKPCGFDSFAHRKNLREHGVRGGAVVTGSGNYIGSTGGAVEHHPEVSDIQVPHGASDSRKVG